MNKDTLDWQAFEKQLRSFIKKRVPRDEVDDITGDVILRLLSNKDKFTAAEKPLAWMYRVTTNVIADYYRNHAKEQATISKGITVNPGEMVNDSDTEASSQLAKCILPLISTLPEPYREALSMTEIEGMKQVDAAKKLELGKSAMKSRVQRGREKLKDAILQCCKVSVNRKGNILDYEARKSCC